MIIDKTHHLLWIALINRMSKLLATQSEPYLLWNYNNLTRLTCVTMSDGRVAIGNVKNPISRWAIGPSKFLHDLIMASDTQPEEVMEILVSISRPEWPQ